MIVLDASAAVDVVLRLEPRGPWVEARLLASADSIHAPHLIDIEVAGAIRRHARQGAVSERAARRALDDFRDLRLVRYPHGALLERIWQLRANLTAADAAYIALAEALGAPLVTTDSALARAPGHRARVDAYCDPSASPPAGG